MWQMNDGRKTRNTQVISQRECEEQRVWEYKWVNAVKACQSDTVWLTCRHEDWKWEFCQCRGPIIWILALAPLPAPDINHICIQLSNSEVGVTPAFQTRDQWAADKILCPCKVGEIESFGSFKRNLLPSSLIVIFSSLVLPSLQWGALPVAPHSWF